MAEKASKYKAVKAALDLAAERGWQGVALHDVAARAGVKLAALYEYFDDKSDILAAYGRMIDRRVLETTGEPDEGLSPRDRLFDLMMERYDALNENRAGVKSVLESFRFDPKQAVIGLPHLGRSMSWMLEAAGIGTAGMKGAVKVAGLTGIHLRVLWVWAEDESPDMAKTMAELDKQLERAERWAGGMGL